MIEIAGFQTIHEDDGKESVGFIVVQSSTKQEMQFGVQWIPLSKENVFMGDWRMALINHPFEIVECKNTFVDLKQQSVAIAKRSRRGMANVVWSRNVDNVIELFRNVGSYNFFIDSACGWLSDDEVYMMYAGQNAYDRPFAAVFLPNQLGYVKHPDIDKIVTKIKIVK